MRIVFFVHRYLPSIGGVERYVAALAGELVARDHDVTVVAGAHAADLPPAETIDGVAVRRFPMLRSPWRCGWSLLRWAPLFRGADVVHVSDGLMLDYFVRMLGWYVAPKCLTVTLHGLSCVHPVPRREIRRAARAHALADATVHDGAFIGKWLHLTPNLIAPQGLQPTAAELADVPEPATPSAVYVGRLAVDMGVELYLDALAELAHRGKTHLPLHVYGDGPLHASLQCQAAASGISVHFHGWQPDAQARIAEHLLAFVSGRMAIHEAMARKRAVVAAYCNPIRRDYVCGEAFSPFIVAGGSGAEIAAHAHQLLQRTGHRLAVTERAFRHVSDRSWARTADAYLDLWARARQQRRERASRLRRLQLARDLWRERSDRRRNDPRHSRQPEGHVAQGAATASVK